MNLQHRSTGKGALLKITGLKVRDRHDDDNDDDAHGEHGHRER